MRDVLSDSARRLRHLALVASVLLVAAYLLGVRTTVGQTVGDAAYLGRVSESRVIRVFDKRFLEAIDIRVFLLGAVALLLIAAVRHQWRAGLVVTGAFLACILAAEVLKRVLARPVLATEVESLMGAKEGLNTLPSGHSTFVTALVLGAVFLVPIAVRPWVAMAGIGAIVVVTGGVVTAGWHRPSDAFAGIALATVGMSLTAAFLVRRSTVVLPAPTAMRLVPYVGVAIAVVAAGVFVLMLAHPDAQGAFALFSVKIVILAWAATAVSVFSRALQAVDAVRS